MAYLKCENCGYEKNVKDEYLGKKVKCPKCKMGTKVLENISKDSEIDPCSVVGEDTDSKNKDNDSGATKKRISSKNALDLKRGKKSSISSIKSNKTVEREDDYSKYPVGKFLWRFIASALDISLISILITLIVELLNLSINWQTKYYITLGIVVFMSAYFQSSPKMASPGKMLLGLRVTTKDRNRISFGRAIARAILDAGLGLIIIGHLIALFNKDRRALHDFIAGTMVIEWKKRSIGFFVLTSLLVVTLAIFEILFSLATIFPSLSFLRSQ